jgi:hypothetical protein
MSDSTLLVLFLLLALPLTFALLSGVIYWVSRRWQGEALLIARETAHVVANTRRETAGLTRVQVEYADLHLQPYTQMAMELGGLIDDLASAATELEQAWQTLEARASAQDANRLRAMLQAAPEAYTQRQMAADLIKRRAELHTLQKNAYGLVRSLGTVPAEISGRSKRAGEGIATLAAVMERLDRAGLQGRLLDEAADALTQMRQAQERFPSAVDSNPQVMRETAGITYDLLLVIEPLLGEWLPRVQGWEQQFQRLVEAGQRLQQTQANFRSALGQPPAGLVTTHFQAALLKVGTAATELQNRRNGLEVQNLRALERETSHLERTLQETALQYDRSVLETAELDRLLLQLESGFKRLAGEMARGETHETFPLAWEATLMTRNDLQERIGALGTREQPRAPDVITQALAEGKAQLERLGALLERVAEQNERYADLERLLQTTELAEGAEWVRKTHLLLRQTAAYDPANWDKADDVAGMPRDLSAVDELQRRLVPLDRPAVIKEGGLARRLEETRGLAALHQKLRPRIERVRARLAELRDQDQDSRDEVERLSTTIDQIALLLNGNSYLQEIAAVELSKLRGEVGRLIEDFGRPEAGVLERKIQRMHAVQESLARNTLNWLERLGVNIQVHTRAINDQLGLLDRMAQLEDREVADAREVLRRLGITPTYRRPVGYLEAAAELKRCTQDWQAAASAAGALDGCVQPVLDAVRDAENARQAARVVFTSAARSISGGRRDWPPVRPAMQGELEEFRKLEARLDGLRAQRWSAGRLVRELGLLYHELDKIDDRAKEALRQVETDRAAVLDAERGVLDLQRQWQGLVLRYPDQPAVGDGARDLVAQTEQRLNYLRAQYRRGAMNYDQIMAGLEDMAESLRGARFRTSDGITVGITDI